MSYGREPGEQSNGTKIAAVNVEKREYQKEYLEYWNDTTHLTGTGRPVDAMIMPVAPFAAARPERYTYYGYSTIINTLDYTSCVIPVTNVDKNIDGVYRNLKYASEVDRQISQDCEYHEKLEP